MTSREWMKANAKAYKKPSDLAAACIKELGLSKSGEIYKRARLVWADRHGGEVNGDGHRKTGRRSFQQLRENHDLSYMIPKAIAEVAAEYLTDGGWLPDSEMLTEVCVRVPRARSRWAQYRDHEKYRTMQVRMDGRLLWIDPEYRDEAERMRAT